MATERTTVGVLVEAQARTQALGQAAQEVRRLSDEVAKARRESDGTAASAQRLGTALAGQKAAADNLRQAHAGLLASQRQTAMGMQAMDTAAQMASARLASMSGGVGALVGGLGVAASGVGLIALGLSAVGIAAMESAKSMGAWVDRVDEAKTATGLTEREIGALTLSASRAGHTFEQVQPALIRFSALLGEAQRGVPEAVKKFDDLDVKVNDMGGNARATGAVLQDTISRLEAMGSSAKATAAATDILSARGARYLVVLKGMNEETARLAELSGVTLTPALRKMATEADVAVERWELAMKRMKTSWDATMAPLGASIANFLSSVVEGQFEALAKMAEFDRFRANYAQAHGGVEPGWDEYKSWRDKMDERGQRGPSPAGYTSPYDEPGEPWPRRGAAPGTNPVTDAERARVRALEENTDQLRRLADWYGDMYGPMPPGQTFSGAAPTSISPQANMTPRDYGTFQQGMAGMSYSNVYGKAEQITPWTLDESAGETIESMERIGVSADELRMKSSAASESMEKMADEIDEAQKRQREIVQNMVHQISYVIEDALTGMVMNFVRGIGSMEDAVDRFAEMILELELRAGIQSLLELIGLQSGGTLQPAHAQTGFTIASGQRGRDTELILGGRGEMVVSHQDTDRLRRMLDRYERGEAPSDMARPASDGSGAAQTINLTMNYSGTLVDRRALRTFAENDLVPVLRRVMSAGTYRKE